MISEADLIALALTLRLAFISTAVLLVLSTPLAWWLARTQFRLRPAVEALVALPLVLPPTVLGFYLLLMLGPNGPAAALGLPPLAFTFTGLVIGSVVYSLPFVVQPLRDAFAAGGVDAMEAAATLRAGPWDRFFRVALPMARPGFVTAAVLGFAHTLGEFGVVLMIGGNIPGSTRVASIAVYDHVEQLQWSDAHALSLLLLALSFALLVAVYAGRHRPGAWPA
jgi:molybdate transport system permease protein